MTKTQALKELRKLANRLSEIQTDFQCLKDEVEETRDSIEPYEGKGDLTTQQEEREEWFGNLWDTLDSLDENIQDALDEMDNLE